jgi:hypothetical protein
MALDPDISWLAQRGEYISSLMATAGDAPQMVANAGLGGEIGF